MATQKKTTKTVRSHKPKQEVVGFWRSVVSLTALGTLWRTAMFTALALSLTVIGFAQSFAEYDKFGLLAFGDTYTFNQALLTVVLTGVFFAMYDAIYVFLARRYWISRTMDRVLLVGLEATVALWILMEAAVSFSEPSLAASPGPVFYSSFGVVLFFIVTLLPPVRAFAGVSYVVATRGIKFVK